MEFAKTLKQLRKKRGILLKELAAVLNVSVGTVSNYENGVHSPDLATLCAIADYFGVSVDYLLGRTNHSYSDKLLKQHISGEYTIKDLLNCIYRLPESCRHLFVDFIIGLEKLFDVKI